MTPIYVPELRIHQSFALESLKALEWLSFTEARQEYFMSDEPRSYTYGKDIGQRTYHSREFSTFVEAIRGLLNVTQICKYNVCFLNRYEHEKHQLGWHADDSPSIKTIQSPWFRSAPNVKSGGSPKKPKASSHRSNANC